MKRFRSSALGVVVAALALVGLVDVATYAANGAGLLLGSSNSESRTATVTNSGTGPALKLNARVGNPAIGVSNTTRIPLLNADMVDGQHASAFVSKSDKLVWNVIPLNSGVATWTSTAPRYAVRNDVVYIRGCITIAATTSRTDAFDLPAAVAPTRPAAIVPAAGWDTTANTPLAADMWVYSSGRVDVYQQGGTDLHVCLDGSFTR